MENLFAGSGFLIVAAAMVSVPIIIHLINRMRFKRIHWAAMEFLLKAQKRTKRRLIIEQLLLLALRCLMIALVGLLVSQFVACGDANLGGKPKIHVVVLDDTPSMQDQWKEDGQWKNCFDVARTDILQKKIVKGLANSRTSDRLIVLPLSKIQEPGFDFKEVTVYDHLNDPEKLKRLNEDIADLKPSFIHVDVMSGVKTAHKLIADNSESHATLHLVGDFRHKDWGQPQGEALLKELVDLSKSRKTELKIRAIDTVHPKRGAGGGFPPSRDNVGIVEIRPSTRIVGKNMPVQFTVVIQNFSGAQAEVTLKARDEITGKDMFDVNYNPQNPITISPSDKKIVTFEKRFNPDLKPGESHFAHVSVRISNPQLGDLENDGLWLDNVRHSVVEVRDKVPVLVIDGEGAGPLNSSKGRQEGGDSFFISRSLISVPGNSYQVVYGDELAGAGKSSMAALERPDLNKFPTIFLLNVPSLTAKQAANLENFVKEGGGVAFFMGPLCVPNDYNRLLYKGGAGVFPAPLKAPYFPAPANPPLEPKGTDTLQLIVRDDKFEPAPTPIFGAIFEEPKHREPLRDLPIRRYFQVARGQWTPEEGRVFELATLPNDAPAASFDGAVAAITQGQAIKEILRTFPKYERSLVRHINQINQIARPGSDAKAYHLANQIFLLRTDKGFAQKKDDFPDLTELWANSDPNVQSVKRQLDILREEVQYGDPYMITQTFGRGKVVAVMSTAGKEWNDFGGGSAASVLFAPVIWEMQNYLSSQGSEANLPVGKNLDIVLDAAQFKGAQLKLVRYFNKIGGPEGVKKVAHGDPQFGPPGDDNLIRFSMSKHNVPGVYISELIDENAADKKPIAIFAHAFNIDTLAEGDLNRVNSDELKAEFDKTDGGIGLIDPDAPDSAITGASFNLSESPWLFLLLLLVLVSEQALAVHLSFHLKQSESEGVPAGAAREPKLAA